MSEEQLLKHSGQFGLMEARHNGYYFSMHGFLKGINQHRTQFIESHEEHEWKIKLTDIINFTPKTLKS